jgi:catechol 2,3-dioxygenase-like lactoylglutathione lyase family enzyme
VSEQVIPVLHVRDAEAALRWYERLGFERDFEHRFEAGLPLYLGIRRGVARMHLSEHAGDARPNTLVYVWVDDVDAIASRFDATIRSQAWGREIELTDPDGNRLRIGQPPADDQVALLVTAPQVRSPG